MATAAATITVTMREADRLKTVQAVVDRLLRVGQAAQRLGLSRRQLERLVIRYLDEGPYGLVSRRRGRPSNNQLAPGVAERAITSFGYFEGARSYLQQHGKPVAFNSDKASIFRPTAARHQHTEGGERVEDLDLIFTWREQRKVSLSLTLNYAREIYMLADTAGNRRLIHRYIDVYEYPDGRIEVRAGKSSLPYVRYDKLPQVDIAAVVENKRLGPTLRAAQAVQARRDDRRCAPSRTNRGQLPRPKKSVLGTASSRQFDAKEFERALLKACKSTESAFG